MKASERGCATRSRELGACDHTIQIPLSENFVFVHEPLQRGALAGLSISDAESLVHPLVGRRQELEELLLRLARSRGGSFLITGYRGVGKTSFVNQVIHELRSGLANGSLGDGRPIELVDVHLSLARASDSMGILFQVIHGLHQRLNELGLLKRVAVDLRSELEIAWKRTSFKIATSRAQGSEAEYGLEGASIFGMVPTLSSKVSRSDQLDLQYLAYDSRAAERDLIRLTQRLTGTFQSPRRLFDRLAFWRTAPPACRLKVVLVFDELDKLQEAVDQKVATPVDRLISVLKNLLTSSGICFLFVAGKDLEERWMMDVGAGDSIYESVFSFNRYLPALWDDTNALVDMHIDLPRNGVISAEQLGWCVPAGHEIAHVVEDFRNFVAFHGRGIPRRSLRLLNGFVRWNGKRCVIAFHRREWRRMRFYSGLEVLLKLQRDALLQLRDHATPAADRDHARLGLYYLVDWMLKQGEASFSPSDAIAASRGMSRKIAFGEKRAGSIVRGVIDLLVSERYLVRTGTSLVRVHGEGVPEPRFRIAPERLAQLGGAEAGAVQAAFPTPTTPKPAMTIDRFTLHELIGEGGFGKVFRATEAASPRDVAVKVLSPDAARSADLRARFQREGEFLRRLNQPGHDGVVRFLDHGQAPSGEFWTAMEFVEGVTLRGLLSVGALGVEEALAIARNAALAYAYVHEKGALRLDVKPANVVIEENGRVVVIDFGIALLDGARDPATTDEFVGTPAYVAPEQLPGGSRRFDARGDVYSLGVVLFEMLAGRRPYDVSDDLPALREAILNGPRPRIREQVGLPVEVMDVVRRAMAPDPDERFASMYEFAQAIAALEAKLKSEGQRRVVPVPVALHNSAPESDLPPPPVAPRRLSSKFRVGPPRVAKPKVKSPASHDRAEAFLNTQTTSDSLEESTPVDPKVESQVPLIKKRLTKEDETKFAPRAERFVRWIRAEEPVQVLSDQDPQDQHSHDQAPHAQTPVGQALSEHGLTAQSDSSIAGVLLVRRVSQCGSVVDEFDVPLKKQMVIGRGRECDVRLKSTEVSRRHVELELIDEQVGQWRVRDLGSANGTTINRRPVREQVVMTQNDQIGIDEFVLTIQLASGGSDAKS